MDVLVLGAFTYPSLKELKAMLESSYNPKRSVCTTYSTTQVQVPAPATHMIHCQEGKRSRGEVVGGWFAVGCGRCQNEIIEDWKSRWATHEAANIAVHISVMPSAAKIWLQRTFGSFCHKRYFSKAWSCVSVLRQRS